VRRVKKGGRGGEVQDEVRGQVGDRAERVEIGEECGQGDE